jgi:excisionase family DNA binding protein
MRDLRPVEQHYAPTELARLWGVSRRTVDRAIAAGSLRAHRIGAAVRIPASAAHAYAEGPRRA